MKKLIAFITAVTTVFTISCGAVTVGNESTVVSSDFDVSELCEISEYILEEESISGNQLETASQIYEELSEEPSYEPSEELSEESSVPHVHTESSVKGKTATCTNDGLLMQLRKTYGQVKPSEQTEEAKLRKPIANGFLKC